MTPAARTAVEGLLDGANIPDFEIAGWADQKRRAA